MLQKLAVCFCVYPWIDTPKTSTLTSIFTFVNDKDNANFVSQKHAKLHEVSILLGFLKYPNIYMYNKGVLDISATYPGV